MPDETKVITVPGFVGVILVLAVLFGGIVLLTWTMEWLTTVFSTPQLIFAFALLVPAAFIIRFISAGALVFNRQELEAMEGGIALFAFLFFGVGFFMISNFLMPQAIKDASEKGDAVGTAIGVVGGLTLMICFGWFYKKLKVRGKLRANLEGYHKAKPYKRQ